MRILEQLPKQYKKGTGIFKHASKEPTKGLPFAEIYKLGLQCYSCICYDKKKRIRNCVDCIGGE